MKEKEVVMIEVRAVTKHGEHHEKHENIDSLNQPWQANSGPKDAKQARTANGEEIEGIGMGWGENERRRVLVWLESISEKRGS